MHFYIESYMVKKKCNTKIVVNCKFESIMFSFSYYVYTRYK